MVAEVHRSQDLRRSLVSAAVAVTVHGLVALVAMTVAERAPEVPAKQAMRPISVRVLSQPRPRAPAVLAPSQPAPVPAVAQRVIPKAPSTEQALAQAPRARRSRSARAVLPAVLVAKVVDGGAGMPQTVQGSGDVREGAAVMPGEGESEGEGNGDSEQPAAAPAADAAPPPPPPEPQQAAEPPEDLQPPEPIERPFGRFPPGVIRPDSPVRVVVALDVTAAGAVSAARVARGAGEPFDGEALVVARSLQFRPARRGGRPVALTVPWVVTFR